MLEFNLSLTFLGEENPEVPLAQITKHKYIKMVTTWKKELQPERPPPTENAIKFHSFRVYLQIQKWLGVDMDEALWGWKKEKDILVPIKSDKESVYKGIKINWTSLLLQLYALIEKIYHVSTIEFIYLFICSFVFVQDPAPAHTLNITRRNCSMNTKNPCRKQCRCKRHGIKCMTACGQCQGSKCTNKMENYDTDSSKDDYGSSEDCDGNIFEKLLDI